MFECPNWMDWAGCLTLPGGSLYFSPNAVAVSSMSMMSSSTSAATGEDSYLSNWQKEGTLSPLPTNTKSVASEAAGEVQGIQVQSVGQMRLAVLQQQPLKLGWLQPWLETWPWHQVLGGKLLQMLGFHDEKGSAVSKQVLLAELEHLSPKEVVVKVAQPPAVQTEGAVELRLVGLCSILPILLGLVEVWKPTSHFLVRI